MDEARIEIQKLNKANENLQSNLSDSSNEIERLNQEKKQLRQLLSDIEQEKNRLQCEMDDIHSLKGNITAEVNNRSLISAQIDLLLYEASLNTMSSRYILSTSGDETLGWKAYMNGEMITSSKQQTVNFCVPAGTYYVRAFVQDNRGRFMELISNAVKSNGKSISFDYKGKPEIVSLFCGKYKLEVWGAQRGDSVGSRANKNQPGKGGLGGYSVGHLTLLKTEKIYILVGGAGKSAKEADGSETSGGFPDGGGTKTGHRDNFTSVPGTGGGSTSMNFRYESEIFRYKSENRTIYIFDL